MRPSLILLPLLMSFASTSAFALASLSLTGGVNYGGLNSASKTVSGQTAEVKGGLGYGGGALLELASVETGVLYVHRTYKTTITGRASTTASNNAIIVPLLYRLSAGFVSLGLGGFYDFGDFSDYGPTASLRLSPPLVGPFFEVRFNYGLETGNEKDVLALIGYRFGL